MSQFKYKPQDWQNYDDRLDSATNVEIGGVVTPERMEHIEEGLEHANMPIYITIEAGEDEFTDVYEEDGKKNIVIVSPVIEPKWKPINITITPSDENSTKVTETTEKKNISIKTSALEPKWPDKLEITLLPGNRDDVLIVDQKDTRKMTIRSAFLKTCVTRATEREVVIDIDDWVEVELEHFEAEIHVEAEILPSNFVKFTKGLEITKEQLREIELCGVEITEKFDGRFIASARVQPTIDLPFHVSIL